MGASGISSFLEEVADHAEGRHHADVERLAVDAVGAEDTEAEHESEEDRARNPDDLHPERDQRQVQHQQDRIADDRGYDTPDKLGMIAKQEWSGDDPIHHERTHDDGNRRRAGNAKREQRDKRGIGIGVVCRLRAGDALDHACTEFVGRLAENPPSAT